MIEWRGKPFFDKAGYVNGVCFFHYSSGWLSSTLLEEAILVSTLEAAKQKADELLSAWEVAAGYIRADEIFSCPECGDSGEYCPDAKVIKEGFEKYYLGPCHCRDNPLSIYNLIQRAKR